MTLSRSAPGVRMGDMRAVQDAAASLVNADAANLTAHAGGLQPLATQIFTGVNEITVCATIGDSAQLPSAIAGRRCYVGNSGVADCTIFGRSTRTDLINSTAGATGVTLAAGKNAMFFCAVNGRWRMILTA